MPELLSLSDVELEPKVDLHLHLDGALTRETIFRVAQEHGIEIPDISAQTLEALSKVYPDPGPFHADVPDEFNSFLKLFGRSLCVMQTPKTIHDATLEVIRDLKKDHVIYAELRFAPSYHTAKGFSMSEMIQGVLDGMRSGLFETGVRTKLIIIIPREIAYLEDYKGPSAREIVQAALEFQDEGVVAIDLACSEHFRPEPYIDAFRSTIRSKLKRTVHAGETGPQMEHDIWSAIVEMHADGIGHALPLPGMELQMDDVLDHRIRIERAPISNRCMSVGDGNFDRIDELLNAGVLVSVNSDDPGIFGPDCSLSRNLLAVANRYGLGIGGIRMLTSNAIKSAFVSADERGFIRSQFRGLVAQRSP